MMFWGIKDVFQRTETKKINGKGCYICLKFSVLQKVDKLYTWQGVSNSLLNDRLTAQREERLAAEQARDMAEMRWMMYIMLWMMN